MIVVLELELVPDRVVAIVGVLLEGDVPRYYPDVTSIETIATERRSFRRLSAESASRSNCAGSLLRCVLYNVPSFSRGASRHGIVG